MTGAKTRYDVALSFAGEDRACAQALAEALKARNISVFYDEYEKATLWGKNLYDYLSDLYQNQARYCVIFISQHYAVKLWTNHERKSAQARAFRENYEYILPLRIDRTEIEGITSTVGYLDWHKETPETLAEAISAKLKDEGSLLADQTMVQADQGVSAEREVEIKARRAPNKSIAVVLIAVVLLTLVGVTLWLTREKAFTGKADPAVQRDPVEENAGSAISKDELLKHIKVLASDEFDGRGPGTAGEEKTVSYLTDQFRSLGLKPGSPDGTYVQTVPLIGITADPHMSLTLKRGNEEKRLEFNKDFVAFTRRAAVSASLKNSELVFVGYGIEAGEFGWDDYKRMDVKGKTLVVLVNDPPVPDPNDSSKLDPAYFGGKAMTYYGRWTYKYEEGARKGAAGVLIVHETGPTGYPFEVVQGSWSRENFEPAIPENMNRVNVEGWLTLDSAKKLFEMAGEDFDVLKKQAVQKDFRPVPLGITASISIHNERRTVVSQNVIAKLEGSDPNLKDEYVVYTAHWDHLGRDPKLQGDQIYNGAVDNASGVAGMLEVARSFTTLPTPPKRSVLFIATTAQEKGLLGSKYYVATSLPKAIASINFDMLNPYGRTKDIILIGFGNSNYDTYVRQVATEQGRVVKPDPEPEIGSYYRSDGVSFAQAGVPSLEWSWGTDFIDRPAGYGKQVFDRYAERDYHRPSDEVKADWDLSGAVEDLQLWFKVGYRLCQIQTDKPSEWSPGAEFKTKH